MKSYLNHECLIKTNNKLIKNNKLVQSKDVINDSTYVKELLNKVLEENQQMKKDLEEVKNNNKINVNINIFLQTECKQAINWFDFIQSLNIGESEINDVLNTNLTASMINVLITGMNKLGVHKRPVHCLDLKRKKLYIRDNNIWIKDQIHTTSTISKGEQILQHKYIKAVNSWEKENININEELGDKYLEVYQKIFREINDKKIRRIISNETHWTSGV
jgi:predicted XRE-type DNA-binding protein